MQALLKKGLTVWKKSDKLSAARKEPVPQTAGTRKRSMAIAARRGASA